VTNVRAGHLWTGKLDNSATYLVAPLIGDDTAGQHSSGGITWTHTDTNDTSFSYSSATKINYVTKWHDVLWGINGSGDLYFTPTLPTDGSTAITWTKTANLDFGQSTDGVVEVKGLGIGPDNQMYAVTQDGLHRYDNQNERFDHVFRLPNDSRGGLGWTVWQGSFFYSRGMEVWRWTPEGGFGQPPSAVSMGLDGDDGLPREYRGMITGLNHSLESLYAQTQVYNVVTQQPGLFRWQEQGGWHMLARPANNSSNAASPMATTGRAMYVGDRIGSSAFADEQYVYSAQTYVASSQTLNMVYPVSQSSAGGDRKQSPTEMDTSTLALIASSAGNVIENQVVTPWVQSDGKQTWNALSVEVEHSPIDNDSINSISDNQQVVFSFQKDFESSETTLGTIKAISDDSPNVSRFQFRAEGKEEGQPFSAMRLTAKWRNTSEISLDVNRISLNFKKTYDPLWGYRFMIDTNSPQGPRSARQIENDLVSLFSEKTLFPFNFHDDVSKTVREVNVTAVSLEAEESPDYKYTGRYVVTVSEVQ